MRSGELAKLTGVSTDTLRHYERMKLLPRPARTASGYRQYPPDAVDRVRMIRRAIAIGFRVDELARVLRVREAGGAPCAHVQALAREKLADVERRIAELVELQEQLRAIVDRWEGRLGRTAPGQRAGLLESLLNEEHS